MTGALLSNTLLAAACGAAAWVMARPARRPAAGHALFVLALAVLLSPPLWRLPLPVTVDHGVVPATVVAPRSGREPSLRSPGPRPRTLGPAPDRTAPRTHPATPTAEQPRASDGAPASTDWRLVATWLWLLGSLLVTARTWHGHHRLHRLLRRTTVPTPIALGREVRAVAAELGFAHPPRVRVVDTPTAPALRTRLGRAELLLPADLPHRCPTAGRRTVLLHELAHLRRGDHRVRVLELLVGIVLWWHPLQHLLRRGLRRAEERACDAWVVALAPGSRRDYGAALLSYAAAPTGDLRLSSPVLRDPLRPWRRRLEEIMTRDLPYRSSRPQRLALVALALGCLPLGLAQDSPQEAQDPLAQLDATRLAVEFEAASLADWTQHLSDALGAPVTTSRAARTLDPTQTTLRDLRLPESSLRKLLDVVTTLTDLRWNLHDGGVVIDVPGGALAPPPRAQLLGAWQTSGPVELTPEDTLLSVLARRPVAPAADLRRLWLHRHADGSDSVHAIDVRAMIESGGTTHDLRIRDGDVLVVPTSRRQPEPGVLQPGTRLRFHLYGGATGPGREQLALLEQPQTVHRDGTIFVPYVGAVYVLGLTEKALGGMLADLLGKIFSDPIQLHARIVEERD